MHALLLLLLGPSLSMVVVDAGDGDGFGGDDATRFMSRADVSLYDALGKRLVRAWPAYLLLTPADRLYVWPRMVTRS